MVVLAASICTRGGKAVLSRQFREMPRSRIEGLLAGFPKLAVSGSQHTTIETENVRFVYQPLDELYMVLITNKASNILQDIDSLHVFAQVVTSICKSLDEREILRNAFELLSAFDEVVALGYRENLTLQQIRTFLEMESHEERIQEIIARNKEFEASEERKRKAKQLDMQRKEMQRSGSGMGGRSGGMGGMGGMGSMGGGMGAPKFPSYTPPPQVTNVGSYDSYEAEKKKTTLGSGAKGKGMQLGKKSKTTDMFERLGVSADEERAPLVGAATSTISTPGGAASPVQDSFPSDPVAVTVEEHISASLARDGTLNSYDVKGTLVLRINDPSLSKLRLSVNAPTSSGAQFKTHPKVDRNAFTSNGTLQTKDGSPFGVNVNAALLRWQSTKGTPPITFSAWVNGGPGNYSVTLEYELTDDSQALKDVIVTIPFSTAEPTITSQDEAYEVSGNSVDWTIPTIDADNASGTFEFECAAEEEAEMFPMGVSFKCSKTVCGVEVNAVTGLEGGDEVEFKSEVKCIADGFAIV